MREDAAPTNPGDDSTRPEPPQAVAVSKQFNISRELLEGSYQENLRIQQEWANAMFNKRQTIAQALYWTCEVREGGQSTERWSAARPTPPLWRRLVAWPLRQVVCALDWFTDRAESWASRISTVMARILYPVRKD